MSETVTLELPENVTHSVRSIARQTHRKMEDVLIDWINIAAAELPVEYLSDAQVLALCDSELALDQQKELSNLLADNKEGLLTSNTKQRLDELMSLYRRGLVRKAAAWKVAVMRGLRSPLN